MNCDPRATATTDVFALKEHEHEQEPRRRRRRRRFCNQVRALDAPFHLHPPCLYILARALIQVLCQTLYFSLQCFFTLRHMVSNTRGPCGTALFHALVDNAPWPRALSHPKKKNKQVLVCVGLGAPVRAPRSSMPLLSFLLHRLAFSRLQLCSFAALAAAAAAAACFTAHFRLWLQIAWLAGHVSSVNAAVLSLIT